MIRFYQCIVKFGILFQNLSSISKIDQKSKVNSFATRNAGEHATFNTKCCLNTQATCVALYVMCTRNSSNIVQMEISRTKNTICRLINDDENMRLINW